MGGALCVGHFWGARYIKFCCCFEDPYFHNLMYVGVRMQVFMGTHLGGSKITANFTTLI